MFNSVRLELTGNCDMKCLYCHAGDKNTSCYKDQELSHDRWLGVIRECKELGVVNFTLTGGEPFLYNRWQEIIEACGKDSRVVISTNGKHFSQKNLNIIAKLPQVKEIRTSIDGLKTNDVIREGSSFKESLNSVRRVKSILPNCKVMIQTVIYEQNIPELLPLYEELKEIGIYSWRLSQLWKTVRTEKNRDIIDFSNYDELFRVYAEVIRQHQSDSKPFLLRIDNVYYSWIDKEEYAPMSLSDHPCAYNFTHLCVNANGDLIFCPALNVKYESLKKITLQEAINKSSWLSDFKKITVKSLGCEDCRYVQICGGGCRADALRWLGKIDSIDPNSCCMMPRIEAIILPILGKEERKAFSLLINKNGSYPKIKGGNIEEAIQTI